MKSIKQFWRECIEDLGDEHQNYLKEQKGDSGLWWLMKQTKQS